jgi:hypothetical protein
MDIANFWLPIIGGILLGGFSAGAFYGGHKVAGVWLGFAGAVCFLLLAAIQIQEYIAGSPEVDPAAIGSRAYVSIESASIRNIADPNGPETIIIIKNSGQTPAYGVTHVNRYALWSYPPIEALPPAVAPDEEMSKASKFDLGPGARTAKYKRRPPIDVATGYALAHGTMALYLYGEILYTDVFKKPHFSRYKMMIGGPVANRGPGAFVVTPDGNESD